MVTWSGFITDRVVERKSIPDGTIVFTLQEDLQSTPPQDVWRQPRTYEYIIAGDGIFEDGMKIYQWPLSAHMTWKAFSDYGYDTHAQYAGIVSTPYGDLKGCYTFILQTNPDTSIDTFCPKIGFVEHSYRHHGTPQIEHYVLESYQPGH
jgi:hypothetical protein